ncbi:metal-dependent hydrolase [Methanobrevibacter sp.]|uniref:metal-dependent hydrolase n=1 Tax=Methanobrevibacter sp. TaxID=66852 RepID=UPI00388D7A65
MSSYKGHSLFALILALMFSFNPLIIALVIIGANIPDFDHKFRKEHVYKLIILGLLIFISLYILNLPYYIGLIIVFLGLTFYFSEHRSFTHSIPGIIILASATALILIWAWQLIVNVTVLSNNYLIAILIALLSFLFLNKRLLPIFIPLFFISVVILQTFEITYIQIVLSLFLGLFSHVVLDATTPAGVKLFAPISSKEYYKNFAIASIFILIILALICRAPFLFSIFENFIRY